MVCRDFGLDPGLCFLRSLRIGLHWLATRSPTWVLRSVLAALCFWLPGADCCGYGFVCLDLGLFVCPRPSDSPVDGQEQNTMDVDQAVTVDELPSAEFARTLDCPVSLAASGTSLVRG